MCQRPAVLSNAFLGAKALVKGNPALKRLALASMRVLGGLGWRISAGSLIRYVALFRDRRRFIRAGGKAPLLDLYPCINDNTSSTGIDSHYFHQSLWAFRRIRESGTPNHVDIASQVNFVGMLTTITRVFFVDIRPLFLSIPNYHGIGASITALPFADNSIESLSCLHVIEHIGLGRYGDPIDPHGPGKACLEISRTLKPGGSAYVSLPIGRPRVSFNGQRVFAPTEVLSLFPELECRQMSVVDIPGDFIEHADPMQVDLHEDQGGLDFGLGMFHLYKP